MSFVSKIYPKGIQFRNLSKVSNVDSTKLAFCELSCIKNINHIGNFKRLDRIVISVMNTHSCDRGSNPGQGNHIYVMLQIVFSSYQINLLLYWYCIYTNK